MADVTRVERNKPATISVTFLDPVTEAPVDPDDLTATVTIRRADESEQYVSQATTRTGAGVFTYTLPGQSALMAYTARWTGTFGGQPRTDETYVEIVGAHYFSVPELRAFDSVLTDAVKYPATKVRERRDEVEDEFERITERAFVPRFARLVTSISDSEFLELPKPEPRSVTKFTIDGVDSLSLVTDGTVRKDKDSPWQLLRTDGSTFDGDIVIEYEYGWDKPSEELKRKAMKRARGLLVSTNARTIDERATVMRIDNFGTFNLATPGRYGSYTGIPDIDVVLRDLHIDGEGGGITIA